MFQLHFRQVIQKKAVPGKVILDELLGCFWQYPNEIEQVLLLSLKKFTHGFAYQKGAIFGFGKNATNDTGSVLKISSLSATELEEMVQHRVQVHNTDEERSFELFSYEIEIKSKKMLKQLLGK